METFSKYCLFTVYFGVTPTILVRNWKFKGWHMIYYIGNPHTFPPAGYDYIGVPDISNTCRRLNAYRVYLKGCLPIVPKIICRISRRIMVKPDKQRFSGTTCTNCTNPTCQRLSVYFYTQCTCQIFITRELNWDFSMETLRTTNDCLCDRQCSMACYPLLIAY